MKWLRTLFGPSRKEVWRQLAKEVGGRFREGDLFKAYAVQARTGDWRITLDTYTESAGTVNQTYTRLRAPYFNPDGFRFEVYRASVFSELGKGLGMQDIRVGHPRFDRDFVIKGNEPRRVRRLLDHDGIRRLIHAQPRVHLSVKGHDGWFGKFPAGVDELHFRAAGAVKDLARLRNLFELFAGILQHVSYDGEAEDDVRRHMRRLRAPGGRITDDYVLWDGNGPRREAAAALGRLGDPAAVPALASVLWDEDAWLRAPAIDALAGIGHPAATGPLVPLLADTREADGRRVRDRAAEVLARLGEGELAETVLAALGGDFGPLKARGRQYRAEIIDALSRALDGPDGGHAANALAGINAVEALPRLRKVLRNLGRQDPTGRAVAAAIRKLEARASLPRAASAADVEMDTLPRAAREPDPDSSTLPRGSRAPSG